MFSPLLSRTARRALIALLLPTAACVEAEEFERDEDDRANEEAYVVHVAHVRSGRHPIEAAKAGSPKESWATGISCVNTSDAPTHVRVEWPGSRVDETCEPIAPGQSYLTFSGYHDQMFGGASVSSDQPVRCTVNVHTDSAATGFGPFATYEAVESSSKVLFVQALRLSGWVGQAFIFNPGHEEAKVKYLGKTRYISANSYHQIELDEGFNDSVAVTVDGPGEIAGVTMWRDLSGQSQSFSAMTGMTPEQGARKAHVPRVSTYHKYRKSGVTIQNAGTVPTDITVRTFFPVDPSCLPSATQSCAMREEVFTDGDFPVTPDMPRLDGVEPGKGVLLFVPNIFDQAGKSNPDSLYGSMIIESSSSDIVVTANENVFEYEPDSPYGASYAAPTESSMSLSLAQVANLGGHPEAPYVSEIQVANASAEAGTCTLKLGPRKTTVQMAPYGVVYAPAHVLAEPNYNGGAIIECTVPVTGVALMQAAGDLSATAAVPYTRPSVIHTPDVKTTQHIETFDVQSMCDSQMRPHGWLCDNSPGGLVTKTALHGLRSSANPTPPQSFCSSPWEEWTATKEYRGYAHIPSGSVTCDASGVIDFNAPGQSHSYGYTRGPNALWFAEPDVYVGPEEGEPAPWFNDSWHEMSEDGQCVSFRSRRASRIANGERAVVYESLGFDQPYVWHNLRVQACCDGSVTVHGSHSQFPDARLYIDGMVVDASQGQDLGEFMHVAGTTWNPVGYGPLAPGSTESLDWSR